MDTELTQCLLDPELCSHSIENLMNNKINPPNPDIIFSSLILDKDTGRMMPEHLPSIDEDAVPRQNVELRMSFGFPPKNCPPNCVIL